MLGKGALHKIVLKINYIIQSGLENVTVIGMVTDPILPLTREYKTSSIVFIDCCFVLSLISRVQYVKKTEPNNKIGFKAGQTIHL